MQHQSKTNKNPDDKNTIHTIEHKNLKIKKKPKEHITKIDANLRFRAFGRFWLFFLHKPIS